MWRYSNFDFFPDKDSSRIDNLPAEGISRSDESKDATLTAPKSNPNKCIVCSKIFSGPAKLTNHLINKHSVRNDQNSMKPFHCDKCDKCYTTSANLAIHKASHTANKTFQCDVCKKSFYRLLSLTNHMSLHTGIRKHQCEVCRRAFTTANILQQHRKTHATRTHICSVCEKGFFTSNCLRVHFRSHSGEKPFLCSACGRNFSRKTHLNIHLSKLFDGRLGRYRGKGAVLNVALFCRNTFGGEAIQVRHMR